MRVRGYTQYIEIPSLQNVVWNYIALITYHKSFDDDDINEFKMAFIEYFQSNNIDGSMLLKIRENNFVKIWLMIAMEMRTFVVLPTKYGINLQNTNSAQIRKS